jgi:hypothetical protein
VTARRKDADHYTVKDAIKAMREEAKAYRKTAKESGQNRVMRVVLVETALSIEVLARNIEQDAWSR